MIDWIFSLFTGARADDQPTSAIALFLAGQTIPRISQMEHPGIGGPELLQAQRAIEDEIRDYINDLIDTIAELHSEIERGRDE